MIKFTRSLVFNFQSGSNQVGAEIKRECRASPTAASGGGNSATVPAAVILNAVPDFMPLFATEVLT